MDGETSEAIPDRGELRAQYAKRRPEFAAVLGDMERRLRNILESASLRPSIKGRIKSFDSYYAKLLRILRQAKTTGTAPISITDIIALRAVCPFLGDLGRAEAAIGQVLKVVEVERKGAERSFREFGYESIHLLVEIPEELKADHPDLEISVVEIQLRTILQEAWAEVEHELVYKAEFTPFDEPMKRKLAALNANLSLSDIIFQEILDYQRRLNNELERRRSTFYGKVENEIDRPLSIAATEASRAPRNEGLSSDIASHSSPGSTMDDLLLAALSAHNREDFDTAIRVYGEILARWPGKDVATMVLKHRGMAHFSRSHYREAIEDFSECLSHDPRCYKAAYYRGVVKSVLLDHAGAVEDFDRALAIHPYHFFSRYRRGMAYYHLGDYTQALADCEAALKLEPENPQALRLRELVRSKLKM